MVKQAKIEDIVVPSVTYFANATDDTLLITLFIIAKTLR